MSVSLVQKGALYAKETQEMGLFTVMTNSRWFAAFGESPLYYIMLPMIGALLTVLAAINVYDLIKTHNRNFDKWLGTATSAVCALLASISLYGSVIAKAMGLTFGIGPWFFLGSLVLAFAQQSTMLVINLFRAFEAEPGSAQRMHYIQAAINNGFVLGLVGAATGGVIFVMLFPISPVVGTAFAVIAAALTALNLIWRVIPHNWKLAIKGFLHLGKPEANHGIQEEPAVAPHNNPLLTKEPTKQDVIHPRLFSYPDYSAQVQAMSLDQAKHDLLQQLDDKHNRLLQGAVQGSEKTQQKLAVILELTAAMKQAHFIDKNDLLNRYPQAFQSFWADKGEVEQLFDAVMMLQNKMNAMSAELPVDVGLSKLGLST